MANHESVAVKPAEKKQSIIDAFLEGARKGWNIGVNSMIPNVLMAFTIILFINKIGLMSVIGKVFAPLMGLFGLPGEAVTCLLSAWLSIAAGVGVAANLFAEGILNARQVAILMPAMYLLGAQLNYMGRCMGLAELPKKHWKWAFLIGIVDAFLAMIVMNILV